MLVDGFALSISRTREQDSGSIGQLMRQAAAKSRGLEHVRVGLAPLVVWPGAAERSLNTAHLIANRITQQRAE